MHVLCDRIKFPFIFAALEILGGKFQWNAKDPSEETRESPAIGVIPLRDSKNLDVAMDRVRELLQTFQGKQIKAWCVIRLDDGSELLTLQEKLSSAARCGKILYVCKPEDLGTTVSQLAQDSNV